MPSRKTAFARAGWRDLGAWTKHASALMTAGHIRATGPGQPVARLSGGNQQEAVLARELPGEPELVIAVNPTRGLDVAASHAVMLRLAEARERGAGVLLVHSDLDELLAWSDRVLVAAGGSLHPTAWPDCTREAIGQLMLGSA